MKIYIVTGQTATGKTKHALQLAEKHDGELINFDSRQIYTHLDIITGKDLTDTTFTLKEKLQNFNIGYYKLNNIPLWLYDIVDPKIPFSAHDFEICVLNVLKDVINRGKTPILVGGTYFYLKYLLYLNEREDSQPNWEFRNELEKKSVQELQEMLQKENEDIFDSLNESDRNNPRRLIRKLELESQDKNLDNFSQDIILDQKLNIPNLEVEIIGFFYPDREKLRQVIQNRVEERLRNGAMDEVKKLLHNGYSENDYGLNTIGYKQILNFLKGTISEEEMIENWVNKELQYAKRQYTFMKKNSHIYWHEV